MYTLIKKFITGLLILMLILYPISICTMKVNAYNDEAITQNAHSSTNCIKNSKNSINPVLNSSDTEVDTGYEILYYSVDVIVNEDNTLDITENITVNFKESRHGIKRYIPITNMISRQDGTVAKTTGYISNVFIDNPYSISDDNNYTTFKIGSSDEYVYGEKSYQICYTYDLGKDTGKNYDELYYNLIGSKWNTTIDSVDFSIEMPKDFDHSKIGVYVGYPNSTDTNRASYNVTGNTISGFVNNSLNPGEAVTIRVELPEGYYVGVRNHIDIFAIMGLIFSLIFTIISLILFFTSRVSCTVQKGIHYDPPYDINSLEVAMAIRKKVSYRDVLSLLPYLCNKGYIKIINNSHTTDLCDQTDIKFVKQRDYDGTNKYEEKFMRLFFSDCFNNVVELSSIDDNFKNKFNDFKDQINISKENNCIIKSNKIKRALISFYILISFLGISIPPLVASHSGLTNYFILGFCILGFAIITFGLSRYNDMVVNIASSFISVAFFLYPWFMVVKPLVIYRPIYLTTNIIGLICIIIMLVLYLNFSIFTPYAEGVYRTINGFKKFISRPNKAKLDELISENPNYIYDIYPYAFTTGYNNIYMSYTDDNAVHAPFWYSCYDGYDLHTFSSFINQLLDNILRNPYGYDDVNDGYSSGGGSCDSGGGCSDGGSGGGGGSSW